MARATLLYSTDQPDSPDIVLACVTAASTSLVLGDHCESLGAALKRDDVVHADRPVRVGRGDPLEDLEGEMSQHRQLRFRERQDAHRECPRPSSRRLARRQRARRRRTRSFSSPSWRRLDGRRRTRPWSRVREGRWRETRPRMWTMCRRTTRSEWWRSRLVHRLGA
jgi:hypothetical protein